MLRRLVVFTLIVLTLIVAFPTRHYLAEGQSDGQARTHYAVTVYNAPDRSNPIIGVLIPQAKVILEARNADSTWVLGRSIDGMVRGWMESRYLDLDAGTTINMLPVGSEILFVDTLPTGDYSTIDLYNYPVLPTVTEHTRMIFESGRAQGRDLDSLSKIGDCISDNRHFLSPFGWGQYNLGIYAQLQPVIDHYGVSLTYDSQSAYNGLVTNAALDPIFANSLACEPGESPLRCEYRVHNSSVAIIMFGAQDLLFTSPDDFDRNLRQIVHETIQAGIIPILSTFPGNLDLWTRAIRYNQIVVQIALDYDIPLMNLWRALDPLPNHGLNTDGRHLSLPLTDSGDLTQPNLQKGYPLRNLITLQALDVVWRGTMN